MGILSWIVFGFLAGLVAGWLAGGRRGIIFHIIIGIVGALLGGFIMGLFGHAGVTGWNLRSFAVAVGGAVVLLLIFRLVRGRGRGR
jgi:uncharacterized membrane protein YeaQ/YmgE (transglycosylase-associated protein family)